VDAGCLVPHVDQPAALVEAGVEDREDADAGETEDASHALGLEGAHQQAGAVDGGHLDQ
jgi:hypothetical protein